MSAPTKVVGPADHCPVSTIAVTSDFVLLYRLLPRCTFAKRDAIGLTKMICDVVHAHNDTTQGTMAIVTSDMTLYTTYYHQKSV